MAEQNTTAQAAGGLEPKTSALLSWLIAPITSIIFLVTQKDEFSKFHAWQSLLWTLIANVAIWVLYTILTMVTFGLGACCFPIVFLPYVVNIYVAIKAYNGDSYKLPLIGDFCEDQSKK